MRFVVSSYISANRSPFQWTLSGPETRIAAFVAAIEDTDGVTVAARARDGDTGFVKLLFKASMIYSDFLCVIERRPTLLQPLAWPNHEAPTADSETLDVSNPHHHLRPLTVGLIGDLKVINEYVSEFPWIQASPCTLVDGRQGLRFTPQSDQADEFDAFVASAAKGQFGDLEVVVLRAAPEG